MESPHSPPRPRLRHSSLPGIHFEDAHRCRATINNSPWHIGEITICNGWNYSRKPIIVTHYKWWEEAKPTYNCTWCIGSEDQIPSSVKESVKHLQNQLITFEVQHDNTRADLSNCLQNIHPSAKWRTVDIIQASEHAHNQVKDLLSDKDRLQESKIGVILDIRREGQRKKLHFKSGTFNLPQYLQRI